MTKTTYLDDMEGNGIELYCESPEDGHFTIEKYDFAASPTDGTISDGREPLDVAALFSYLKAEDRLDAPLPGETRVGHVHLYVQNVREAVDFVHGSSKLFDEDQSGLIGAAAGAGKYWRAKYQLGKGRCAQRL